MSVGPEFVHAGPLGDATAVMAKHGSGLHGLACASLMSTPLVSVEAGDPLHVAIAGLVAIAAGPDFADHAWALFIGAVGGIVCTSGMKLLLIMKIDDEVGAVSAHMGAGVWGTLAVSFTHDGDLLAQLAGVAAVGGFVFVSSFIVWWIIDVLMGVRNPPQVERAGQDLAELGIVAYPEFMLIDDVDHAEAHPSPHP